MFEPVHAFSGFSVDDVAAAQSFYHDSLGLKVEQTPEGMTIHLPGDQTVFAYPKDDHQPAAYTILNFVVKNIDEAVDTLVQRGVVFERYGNMPFQQDDKGIARGKAAGMGPDIAWFKDPAGNILAVLQD